MSLGTTAWLRHGRDHRPVVRVDTQWLADVVTRLEECPELLEHLDVVFSNLATRRGGRRLEVPQGRNRVSIRYTSAVHLARDASASPIRFGALADKVTETFPDASQPAIRRMLAGLVRQGFLITCLRAPLTVTDPLGHLAGRLREAGADTMPSVASLLSDLEAIGAEIERLNHGAADTGQAGARTSITRRMRQLSQAGRTALAVDLLLHCDAQLPEHVVWEMERAASALLRMTRQPASEAAWRDYRAGFCDRYGTGTLVPLLEVVDPDAGVGYPAGYPGSALPLPVERLLERDEQLLALAWQATANGSREITLTDEIIRALADGDQIDERYIPPHVELSARIDASSLGALETGDYTLTVAPARAAGPLTSRFTPAATGCGLENVYRDLPTATEGALPVQLSFPPVYPHAENVCRVPLAASGRTPRPPVRGGHHRSGRPGRHRHPRPPPPGQHVPPPGHRAAGVPRAGAGEAGSAAGAVPRVPAACFLRQMARIRLGTACPAAAISATGALPAHYPLPGPLAPDHQ